MTALAAKHRIARGLESVVHWLLFAVSAVLSVRLFVELASTAPDKLLYGAMACGFEGTKIILWEVGTRRQRLIALLMVGLSLVASAGAALAVSARAQEGGTSAVKLAYYDDRTTALQRSIEQTSESIEALTAQARGLPPDYITAATRLQAQITALYERSLQLDDQRRALTDEREAYVASTRSQAATTMFAMLADALHTTEERFVLYFMLCVAVLLEVGALGTTLREGKAGAGPSMPALNLAVCACGSKRTALERAADGQHYGVVCRACGRTSGLQLTELEAREEWALRNQTKERSTIWQRLTAKLRLSRRKAH